MEDHPGVTRDRKLLEAEWLGVPFRIIDTGGWMPGGSDLEAKVSRQVEAAVRDADVVLFVVDGTVGMTDDDEVMAGWLRRGDHDVIVVANKTDNDRREDERWQFLALGLGEPYPVSALHGRRAGDLLDVVISKFPAAGSASLGDGTAGDGRRRRRDPTERSDVPWTPTSRARRGSPSSVGRTSASRRCSTGSWGRTAPSSMTSPARRATHRHARGDRGRPDRVRRHGGHAAPLAHRRLGRVLLARRALRSIDDADIALLVIDATEGITGQDQRLAERIDAAGCPILSCSTSGS